MTDQLQQKAAEIVREQLGYQVPASLESMRVDHPYEYHCALAGLTAGIAMAADTFEDEYANHEGPLTGVVNGLKAIRALAKGETQEGRVGHCDDL